MIIKFRVLLVGAIFFVSFSFVKAEDQAINLPKGIFDIYELSFEGPHWGGRLPLEFEESGKKIVVRPKGSIEFKPTSKSGGLFKLEFQIEGLVTLSSGVPEGTHREENNPAPALLEGNYELKDGNVLVLKDKHKVKTRLVVTCHASTLGPSGAEFILMCDGVFIGSPPWFIGKDSSYYNGYLYSMTFQQPYKE